MAHGAFKTLDNYKLISADSHIVEPPDLYTEPDRARGSATGRRGMERLQDARRPRSTTPGCSTGSRSAPWAR